MSMNRFERLLESDLREQRKETIKAKPVKFDIDIDISNYDDRSDLKSINLEYAKRDTKLAVEIATSSIENRVGPVPLSILVDAKYKKINKGQVVYTITVDGGDTRYLQRLAKKKL